MAERLGKYELMEQIGKGGFSAVFLAIHTQLKSKAAIKILDARRFQNESEKNKFLEEARTAAKLKHAHLVEVFDLIREDNRMAIAMEYMAEGSLRNWMQETRSIPAKIEILRQVAAGLDALHKKHLIHRDVKPENILIQSLEPLAVKLSDFGLVVEFDASTASTSQHQAITGTVYYLSPEQARDMELGPRSDQYSLACVAYELLVGQRPFDGKNPVSIAIQRLEDGMPKKPSQVNIMLSQEFDNCILKALSKDPDQRYESCQAFVAALDFAWKESQLRLFNDWLDQAEQELARGAVLQSRQELDKAASLFPDNSRLLGLRQRLEQREAVLLKFTSGLDAWKDARNKARAVLALAPDYPDPAGLFVLLGVKPAVSPRNKLQVGFVRSGTAILLALPAALLVIYIVFRLIIVLAR